MRRLLLSLLLALSVAVQAADWTVYESITVANTSIGFGATTLNPSGKPQINACQGRLETAEIRYLTTGDAPTTTTGILMSIGDTVEIWSHNDASRFRAIRTGSTSGTLMVQCWP